MPFFQAALADVRQLWAHRSELVPPHDPDATTRRRQPLTRKRLACPWTVASPLPRQRDATWYLPHHYASYDRNWRHMRCRNWTGGEQGGSLWATGNWTLITRRSSSPPSTLR